MAWFRFWTIVFLLWILEILLTPLSPSLWVWFDPLFLLLIFCGLHQSSGRSLWLVGASMGFFKDLGTGGVFGGYTCTFALIGWFLESSRDLVEREDPLMQGLWAGFFAALSSFLYGVWIVLADPSVHWNIRWWLMIPSVVFISAACAVWGFPRLRRLLRS